MENLEAAIWPIFFGSVGSQYAQFWEGADLMKPNTPGFHNEQ